MVALNIHNRNTKVSPTPQAVDGVVIGYSRCMYRRCWVIQNPPFATMLRLEGGGQKDDNWSMAQPKRIGNYKI